MSTSTISDYLESDHRRLDRVLTETVEAAGAGSLPQAARTFAAFQKGIERHIDLEERLLLPFFEEATGPSGPAEVMREEHARILRLADSISSKLQARDGSGCLEELDALARLLSAHNLKEERVLYPAIERVLQTLGQRDETLRRMQVE